MPGPTTEAEAWAWIQDAVANQRYKFSDRHYEFRSAERGLDIYDVHVAVAGMTRLEPYTRGTAQNGGTCWRAFGPNVDGTCTIAVGVEAYLDKRRHRVVVITLFKV
jgi:hypothetical protein